jgi:formylglycine-generating enzyme required for sulfatase activity
MKTRTLVLLLAALFIATLPLAAQETRFFRVAGPVPATITETTPAGIITWTNLPTNGTFTVQTATFLAGGGDWVDWTQASATNPATTLQVFASSPPAGMALIPAGSFLMGATTNMGHEYDSDEVPQHSVYVSAFYMDKYEVTKALWDEVKAWNGGNGYDLGSVGLGKAVNHPVHSVKWYDAVKWCNARSQKEGRVPCYYTDAGLTTIYKTGQVALYVKWSANGYRLPTEAEWEKAARGGASGHRFPWSDSDTIQHSRANYYVYRPASTNFYAYDTSPTAGYHPTFATGAYPYTSPAGYFAPNGYGLYDMAGNVWEWCWDWYSSTYYSSSPSSDPRGAASGSYRVLRGGYWNNYAFNARCANRYKVAAFDASGDIGFRCVRGL